MVPKAGCISESPEEEFKLHRPRPYLDLEDQDVRRGGKAPAYNFKLPKVNQLFCQDQDLWSGASSLLEGQAKSLYSWRPPHHHTHGEGS